MTKGISKKTIKDLEKHRQLQEKSDEVKIETVRRQLSFDYLEGVPDDGIPYFLRWGSSNVLAKVIPFSRRKDIWYMDGYDQSWKREQEIVMVGRRKTIDESLSINDNKWGGEDNE